MKTSTEIQNEMIEAEARLSAMVNDILGVEEEIRAKIKAEAIGEKGYSQSARRADEAKIEALQSEMRDLQTRIPIMGEALRDRQGDERGQEIERLEKQMASIREAALKTLPHLEAVWKEFVATDSALAAMFSEWETAQGKRTSLFRECGERIGNQGTAPAGREIQFPLDQCAMARDPSQKHRAPGWRVRPSESQEVKEHAA